MLLRNCFILVMFLAVTLAAEERQLNQPKAGHQKMSVHLIECRIFRRSEFPQDFPLEALAPNDPPGFELTFLIKGENLTMVKHQSLTLERFKTAHGRDLLTGLEKPPFEQGYAHLFLPTSHEGRYQSFKIRSDEMLLEELEGLKVKGTITVLAAEGTEMLKSKPMNLSKPSTFRIEDITVTSTGEFAATQLGGLPRLESDSANAPVRGTAEIKASSDFYFSLDGDLERVAEIDVLQGDEKLEQIGFSRTNDHGEFQFRKATDEDCRIQLKCWKNRREVIVPFEATVSLKNK